FTCFPAAFADISIGLFAPRTFMIVGIVLRGAAYAYRAQGDDASRLSVVWGHVFGVASMIAPFFFGAAVGGLTVGNYAWSSPFALTTGALAVALCAQIAAVFLAVETRGELQADFRARAITATFVLAAVGALALVVARTTAPAVFVALGRAQSVPGIATAMVLGFAVLFAMWSKRYAFARVIVAFEAIAVLAGWYASQAPYLVPGVLTFAQAAAPTETLRAFLWLTAGGALLLIPSLWLLFRVFKSESIHPA
ncbi:MAG: cytochrome d ubiquinol oxidase subunit II, partial [Candidatus Eremiobacteraeota bacterium]|nr:cytochrome d ubiquinol oxidase subunit II [Candidatus Eremiobacteraeota bacterium]